MVILSCQKSANPSRSRRKNLSRNEESNDTTNENRIYRRLADTRDLKSLSGDRVRVRPPSAACKSPESFVDPNGSGLFLRSCGFLTGSWSSWQHKRAGHCKSCKKLKNPSCILADSCYNSRAIVSKAARRGSRY